MTLYLLKVHLQTFPSIPIPKKISNFELWQSCRKWAVHLIMTRTDFRISGHTDDRLQRWCRDDNGLHCNQMTHYLKSFCKVRYTSKRPFESRLCTVRYEGALIT
jgi:hypothetical protein